MIFEIEQACGHIARFELSLAIPRDDQQLEREARKILGKRDLLCLPCWKAERQAIGLALMPDLPPILYGSSDEIGFAISIRPEILLACQGWIQKLAPGKLREQAEQAYLACMRRQDARFWLDHRFRKIAALESALAD